MALEKEKSVFDGQATGSYWRLTKAETFYESGQHKLFGILGLFMDQAKSETAQSPLEQRNYLVAVTKEQACGDLKEQLYTHIKATDEFFADADDVLEG